jgi:iron(III) transport system ATP-binding protein
MPDVEISGLTCKYGTFTAVDDISLTVADGEFLTLLGPSGCGKSTTLNVLAGLERPTAGRVRIGKEVFFDGDRGVFVEPENRNLGLVFQSYALWPHMTVRDNIAFALKLRGTPRAERETIVQRTLSLVEMEPLIDRYPNELSGGQQQRVALARTLAYNPSVLLLDEPLSNLDAKLRDRARAWLRGLQRQIRLTTVFVTHDQIEALAMSDRIAVMDRGRIVQVGTPREIYNNPSSPFIADFIGTSNFLRAEVVEASEGRYAARLAADGTVVRLSAAQPPAVGASVTIACRPERIALAPADSPPGVDNVLAARVVDKDFLGARLLYSCAVGKETIRVESALDLPMGDVRLTIPEEGGVVFPA